ncbi:MAG: hypothetical protein LBJ92_02230 [Holosporales bacterium]|jgi:hypothetical protein|nr:hypothetical protein [Holosporales bacterium]
MLKNIGKILKLVALAAIIVPHAVNAGEDANPGPNVVHLEPRLDLTTEYLDVYVGSIEAAVQAELGGETISLKAAQFSELQLRLAADMAASDSDSSVRPSRTYIQVNEGDIAQFLELHPKYKDGEPSAEFPADFEDFMNTLGK